MKKLILICCASAIVCWAASTTAMRGPVTGFFFDPQAHAIRPMVGIPGAAYLGSAVVASADAAFVAPDGSAAFVVHAGRLTLFTSLGSAAPVSTRISGAVIADQVAWASTGASAAVYSSHGSQVQILTNLAAKPAVGAPVDVSAISGQVTTLAFDGQLVLLAVAGDAGGVYSVAPSSAPQRIASAMNPSAMALAGADLYFADQQSEQIWHVRSYAQQPAAAVFSSDAGISSPVGLQLSADGARLFLANAGNRTVGVYDVASRSAVESLPLSFVPSGMSKFGDQSVFLLNAANMEHGPLYVLSDSAVRRAVYFVPSPASPGWRAIRYHPN